MQIKPAHLIILILVKTAIQTVDLDNLAFYGHHLEDGNYN